jgi:hypothetical protein
MRLFGFELTWATAAFGAVLPERTALPHGIVRMNPAGFLAETIAGAPLVQSVGLRLALWVVALAPLWLLRTPKTISGLVAEERELVLARLLASSVYPIRQLAFTFKALASMLYAQSADARRAMTESSDGQVLPEAQLERKRGAVITLRPPRPISIHPVGVRP